MKSQKEIDQIIEVSHKKHLQEERIGLIKSIAPFIIGGAFLGHVTMTTEPLNYSCKDIGDSSYYSCMEDCTYSKYDCQEMCGCKKIVSSKPVSYQRLLGGAFAGLAAWGLFYSIKNG